MPRPAPRRIEHTRGLGRCSVCALKALPKCPTCGERTLHRVAGEDVCERRCRQDQGIQDAWRREMREALERTGLAFVVVPA